MLNDEEEISKEGRCEQEKKEGWRKRKFFFKI